MVEAFIGLTAAPFDLDLDFEAFFRVLVDGALLILSLLAERFLGNGLLRMEPVVLCGGFSLFI
jgi:hypothetical protein